MQGNREAPDRGFPLDLRAMYRAFMEAFARECVARVAAGEQLDGAEGEAFSAYLVAREAAGRPLLGARAGRSGSFDTSSGRCGHRPAFR